MTSITTPPARAPMRVMIVDDHPMVRAGLRALLDVADIEVVGEATSGVEAVAIAALERPDVVLMDVRMPEGNGLEATSALRDASPDSRVLIITSFEDEDYLRSALAAGAHGFLLKRASRSVLLESIRAIHAGGSTFPRDMVANLASRGASTGTSPEAAPPIDVGALRIDPARHLVLIEGSPLILTYLEFRALHLLAEAAGDVVTYARLQSALWPDQPIEDGEPHRIVALVARLRSRLGDARGYLQTVKRVGYRLAGPGRP